MTAPNEVKLVPFETRLIYLSKNIKITKSKDQLKEIWCFEVDSQFRTLQKRWSRTAFIHRTDSSYNGFSPWAWTCKLEFKIGQEFSKFSKQSLVSRQFFKTSKFMGKPPGLSSNGVFSSFSELWETSRFLDKPRGLSWQRGSTLFQVSKTSRFLFWRKTENFEGLRETSSI